MFKHELYVEKMTLRRIHVRIFTLQLKIKNHTNPTKYFTYIKTYDRGPIVLHQSVYHYNCTEVIVDIFFYFRLRRFRKTTRYMC